MSEDVTLRWCAAEDAIITTIYAVYSDKTASGVFVELSTQEASDRGDGAYTAYATTLVGNITATGTTVVVADATNFAAASYVMVDKEMIKLGTKDTVTFSGCLRSQGGTIAQAHTSGAAITLAHEFYIDSNLTLGDRHCIRYKVVRREGTLESIAYLMLALLPTLPLDASLCTVYGVVQTVQGAAQAGVVVTLTLAAADNLDPSTGEVYSAAPIVSTVTDADGYFEIFMPRNVYRVGADIFTLTVGELEWEIATVPDVPYINFLEL